MTTVTATLNIRLSVETIITSHGIVYHHEPDAKGTPPCRGFSLFINIMSVRM